MESGSLWFHFVAQHIIKEHKADMSEDTMRPTIIIGCFCVFRHYVRHANAVLEITTLQQ